MTFIKLPMEGKPLYPSLKSDHVTAIDTYKVSIFNEEYGDKVMERLKGVKNKETIQFRMNEPEESIEGYQWEMLAYPVMQALGIRGEEL